MGIRQPLEKTFRCISFSDADALMLPADELDAYAESADFDDLKSLGTVSPPPTVFECRVLSPDLEQYTTPPITPDDLWQLFRAHVISISTWPDVPREELRMASGSVQAIAESARGEILKDVREEIAMRIISRARRDTLPFSPPAFWRTLRDRLIARRAIGAGTGTASETPSA